MKSLFGVEERDGVLILIDLQGRRSVTNDAEAIVEYLKTKYNLDSLRIVYQDSCGLWDGLAVRNGRFDGFVMLGASTQEDAARIARTRASWKAAQL